MNSFAISFREAIVTLFGGARYWLTIDVAGTRGDINFFVGPNAAGKTLALKSLAYIFRVKLDPIKTVLSSAERTTDVSHVDVTSSFSTNGFDLFRAKCTYLHQNPRDNFDSSPLSDHIRAFLQQSHFSDESMDNIIKLLSQELGLTADDLTRLPDQFSSGQQQAIALALRVISRPDFILLDEPFSRLSRNSVNKLMDFCFRYLRGSHIIAASHENELSFLQAPNIIINRINRTGLKIETSIRSRFTPSSISLSQNLLTNSFTTRYLNSSQLTESRRHLQTPPQNYVIFIQGSGENINQFRRYIRILSGQRELTRADVSLTSGINLIVGDNGSGKTLMARAIAGRISFKGILFGLAERVLPSQNLYYISDRPFYAFTRKSRFKWRERFFIPAEPSLISERTIEEAYKLCSQKGKHLLDKAINRLNISLSERIDNVSYGVKKIIQLCLVPDIAQMVVLDDPFGSLSHDMGSLIGEYILNRVDEQD